MNRSLTVASTLLIIVIVTYVLVIGKTLLIPLIMAIFIWHLLNTITNSVKGLPKVGNYIPYSVAMLVAIGIVVMFGYTLFNVISSNVNDVIQASSRYQANLIKLFNSIDNKFHIKVLANLQQFMQNISIQNILVNIYGVFTSITGYTMIISLYVIFLFIEQQAFKLKLNALFPQKNHRQLVDNIMTHIVQDTQTYVGLKSLMSLTTALSSWIIMTLVGLDFAEFWALLIFFLNFIPNIGSIIATIFPALLALIQFETYTPFIVITSGIIIVQFIMGNIIEPRYMGNSLNLSPLVILFALSVWGALWGILGMFLSVPITVIMMIIFAHFDKTRPVAIFLSQDGNIQKSYGRR